MRLTISILLAMWMTASAHVVGAQPRSPSARLLAALPQLFEPGTLEDAAELGESGARLVRLTPQQRQWGLQLGDVVYAVDGAPLGAPRWDRAAEGEPTLTVLRRVRGDRPVLASATIGRQVLRQFTALPEAQQTPMRLARMIANQKMLSDHGVGVLLVPSSANASDAAWLRVANPMPRNFEAAVADVRDALRERVTLPASEVSDAEAARRELADGDDLTAMEFAARALLGFAAQPENRVVEAEFRELATVYRTADRQLAARRAEFLAPAPLFGIVLEGALNRVQAFLPQNTLLAVENSLGGGIRGGVRMRVVPKLDAMLLFGIIQNTFDDESGIKRIDTLMRPVTLEIAYRPLVLSRLKPLLRAGVGVFPIRARVFRSNGEVAESRTATDLGIVLGGGIDAFYWRATGLRATLGATFRLLDYAFVPGDADAWASASNLPPGNEVTLDQGRYELDMDGWHLSLMLTWDF